MGERADVEICTEFAIGARKNVFVEQLCDTGRVVVGRMQDRGVFHEIDADQKSAAA